jgi:hypothetical protein
MDKSDYRSLACFLCFDSRDLKDTRRLKSAGCFIRPPPLLIGHCCEYEPWVKYVTKHLVEVCGKLEISAAPVHSSFVPSLGVMITAVAQLGDHQPYRVNLQQAALEGGKLPPRRFSEADLAFDYLELHLGFVPRPCSLCGTAD